ncbi:kinesin-like protein KIN-14I isoform X2 [Wolffia australiana]
MAPEGLPMLSVAAVVEDVLQQHGIRPREIDMASRRSEEAACRRHEAAGWLRKILRANGSKDLPDEPTEEEFLLALRSGIILCNALNYVHPEAVPKVVEKPLDLALLPDGTALSAYQYFENIRNFLVVVQDKGLPTFEASDLEKGGKCTRVVNCVLALKSYFEWKEMGGTGAWKYGGNLKTAGSGNYFIRKNSELFMNSFLKNAQVHDDQNLSSSFNDGAPEMATSHSLNLLVKAVLSEKKPEEIPSVVESMLRKVVEEFGRRMNSENEVVKPSSKEISKRRVLAELTISSERTKVEIEEENYVQGINEEKISLSKHNSIFEKQQKDIQELKNILRSTRAGMQTLQSSYIQEISVLGRDLGTLADAASRYRKVLEENRRLYNEVQDLRGNIRVYCRVRPFLPGERSSASSICNVDEGSITVVNPFSKNARESQRSFNFNKVFGPSAKQGEIYSDTQPLIRSVLDGFNVCIFAYGQTGSGKTHTMMGPNDLTEESMGVNYRALSDLFDLSEQRKDTITYQIAVQMIEIYNEQVRDLLANDGVVRRLEIRSGSQKGLNVPNASLVPVSSTADVIGLMSLGQRNRAVSSTALNDRSSRSHSCLTVHVHGTELASGGVLRGCMHLVDLAGSERVQKSEVAGDRMKEAQHINRSLSALGDVIASLAQKNAHVPYRNSKLTQLLQDSLGGQAKTLMFVHVSPDQDAAGETLSTLKFADRVSSVELGSARPNKDTSEVKDLKDQIASLKAALGRREEADLEETPAGSKSTSFLQRSTLPSPLTKSTPLKETNKKEGGVDLQERLLAAVDSPRWPESTGCEVDEDNESMGEWVDKVMVNKEWVDWAGRDEPTTPLTGPPLRRQGSVESVDSDSSESDLARTRLRPPQPRKLTATPRRTLSQPPCPPSSRKVASGPNRAGGRPKQAQ